MTKGRKVDLFLGGPLGLWVLDNVDPGTVCRVITFDDAIFDRANELSLKTTASAWEIDMPTTIGLSVHYPKLLDANTIAKYEHIYNIHPGLLPWGRCYYPVFWSLWADEPAGCTLHEIDEGIDTGPIVAQNSVPKYDWDTGGTLHQRVSESEKGLFLEYWPRIVSGDLPAAIPQPAGGSFHLKREFFEMKSFVIGGPSNSKKLVKLIRCLSHPDYTGMVYRVGRKEFEISMRPV